MLHLKYSQTGSTFELAFQQATASSRQHLCQSHLLCRSQKCQFAKAPVPVANQSGAQRNPPEILEKKTPIDVSGNKLGKHLRYFSKTWKQKTSLATFLQETLPFGASQSCLYQRCRGPLRRWHAAEKPLDRVNVISRSTWRPLAVLQSSQYI